MPTVIQITLKTAEDVVNELRERLPHLNPIVKGEPNKWVWLNEESTRSCKEILKEVGFKWSSKRGAWYHSCDTDPTKWKRRKRTFQKAQPVSAPSRPTVQPSTNNNYDVEDEFARRFQ